MGRFGLRQAFSRMRIKNTGNQIRKRWTTMTQKCLCGRSVVGKYYEPVKEAYTAKLTNPTMPIAVCQYHLDKAKARGLKTEVDSNE